MTRFLATLSLALCLTARAESTLPGSTVHIEHYEYTALIGDSTWCELAVSYRIDGGEVQSVRAETREMQLPGTSVWVSLPEDWRTRWTWGPDVRRVTFAWR